MFKIRKNADFEQNTIQIATSPVQRQALSCQQIILVVKSDFLNFLATSRISAYAGIPAFYIHYKKEF